MSSTVARESDQPLLPTGPSLPPQDWMKAKLILDRHQRALEAHNVWAERAKQAVDFFEGRQWSPDDLAKLMEQKRPHLTINRIRPLVNLVMGYFLNNKVDRKAVPTNDGTGSAEIADMISQIFADDADANELSYVDAAVYLDGLIAERGYWDIRPDFDRNVLGETRFRAVDPFSVVVDPDAQHYDLNDPQEGAAFLHQTAWLSFDQILEAYGPGIAENLRPYSFNAGMTDLSSHLAFGQERIAPETGFGEIEDDFSNPYSQFNEQYQYLDHYRKLMLRIDAQHWVKTWAWVAVDLDTGDTQMVPDHWDKERIAKVQLWAQQTGQPIKLMRRLVRRLRWTHIIGPWIVYDEWAPTNSYTLVPFFPYFRRGKTGGMVTDLIDLQREINVRRSARLNIIGRSANGGWLIEENTLTTEQEANLEENGGKPGFILKWRAKNGGSKPEQIHPQQSPVSIAELEHEATGDIIEVAGINRAALGQIDQSAMSGRAINARQQQAVIGLEGFRSNYHRSVKLTGRRHLEIVQTFYTTPRLLRIAGKNEKNPVEMIVNMATAEGVINDITVGRYRVSISETSHLDDFLAGQFNELLEMVKLGFPIPPDFLIDASSLGRKEELKQRLAQQAQSAPPGQPPPGREPPPTPAGSPGPAGASQPSGPPQPSKPVPPGQ